jgi:hypothetical protein
MQLRTHPHSEGSPATSEVTATDTGLSPASFDLSFLEPVTNIRTKKENLN